jgi:translin
MNWEEIVADLKAQAQRMHEGREAGLAKCRSLIQTSAKSIRCLHRHQFEEAEGFLAQARKIAEEAREALRPFPELYHAGYLQDAEKEMVEAAAMASIVRGRPYPTPSELGVGLAPFLNGMAEAASEARRYALDELRKGSLQRAEDILSQMETIYDDLITFDYPDGMTGGLRRSCDALRAVIERTRSDLTTTAGQQELIQELRRARGEA